jgi:hypothetical protein
LFVLAITVIVIEPSVHALLRYNQFMGGVDRCDQIRGTFSMEKALRTRFWYKKLFLGIFGVVLSNAYVLWRTQVRNPKKQRDLHYEFYNGLMNTMCGQAEVRQQRPQGNDEVRLNNSVQHFLEKVVDEKKGKVVHARCVMCSRVNVESRACCRCDKCMVFLCSPHTGRDCMKKFHTLPVLPTIQKKVRTIAPRKKRLGRPPKVHVQQTPALPPISK